MVVFDFIGDVAEAAPTIRMEAAMLSLPSRPAFLVPDPLPPSGMTLWERLCLSWLEPEVFQDVTRR